MNASAAEVETSGRLSVRGWYASLNLLLLSGMIYASGNCVGAVRCEKYGLSASGDSLWLLVPDSDV